MAVNVKVEGRNVVVTLPLDAGGAYQTEKGNWNLATTRGFRPVEGLEQFGVSLSLNLIAKKRPTAPTAPVASAKPTLRKRDTVPVTGK